MLQRIPRLPASVTEAEVQAAIRALAPVRNRPRHQEWVDLQASEIEAATEYVAWQKMLAEHRREQVTRRRRVFVAFTAAFGLTLAVGSFIVACIA